MSTGKSTPSYTVSVVIPAHNSADTIGRAIDSVLAQTHRADEIIVVDDGSTDNTVECIGQYGGQVRYIRQENAGPGPARNTGIKAARCDWIAFLDADDEWLPEKLRLQIELLGRHETLVWASARVFCCLMGTDRLIDQGNSSLTEAYLANREYFEDCLPAIARDLTGHTDTMIIRRDAFAQVGLFETDIPYGEELDLWLRIAYRWPQLGHVNRPLAIYNVNNPESLMGRLAPADKARMLCELYARHKGIAAEYDQSEACRLFFASRLRRWIYTVYRQKDFAFIQDLLVSYETPLAGRYRSTMRFLTKLPPVTKIIGKRLLRLLRYDR